MFVGGGRICRCLPAFILANKKPVVAFSYFCHACAYILHQQNYYDMQKCKLEVRWAVKASAGNHCGSFDSAEG